MIEKTLVDIIQIGFGAIVVIGILIILSSTVYDLRSIAQKKRLQSAAQRLDALHQPSVTVLVYARNNCETIVDCLASIKASQYSNYRVIVVNNASDDMTKKIVFTYAKRNKQMSLSIYSTDVISPRNIVLRQAQKKVVETELLLIINANETLTPQTLKAAVAHFVTDHRLLFLRLRRHNVIELNIATLPAQFIRLSQNIFFKAISRLSVKKRHYLSSGIILRSTAFTSTNLPTHARTHYASTVLYSSPLYDCDPQRAVKPIVKFIAALAVVILVSYFIYTAATLQSNILLTLSWLMVSLWLLAITWSDEVMSLSMKLGLTTVVPVMYLVSYVSVAIYLFRALKCTAVRMFSSIIRYKNLYIAIQLEAYSTRY